MKTEFPFAVIIPKKYKMKKRKRLRYEAILTDSFHKAIKDNDKIRIEMLKKVSDAFLFGE